MSFSFLDKLSSSTEDDEKDEFDMIKCPNTFDDDSQLDRFFDTHHSTPSPKLRRSQRLKKKQDSGQLGGEKKPKQLVVHKTPPKASSTVSSYATCESSTPYSTPTGSLTKATTTPGPPPRSLLKLAIGNSARNRPMITDALGAVAAKPRTGPQTSTPKYLTKVVQVPKNAKENKTPDTLRAEPEIKVKRAPRATVVISKAAASASASAASASAASAAIRPGSRSVSVKRTLPNSTASSSAAKAVKTAASRVDSVISKKATTASKAKAASEAAGPQKPKKTISQKITPDKPKKRKSLKTILKKRQNIGNSSGTGKNRVEAARKAAAQSHHKAQKPTGDQYAHIKSKVAQLINNGPTGNAPNVRDMKRRAADLKSERKTLHDKPFLPAGKVKYVAAVDVVPGDLTVNGQTMAQFVKNFHYQTPPRYRTLKPTDNFRNTCLNHTVQSVNPTVPKSPKFATNARRRNNVKQ